MSEDAPYYTTPKGDIVPKTEETDMLRTRIRGFMGELEGYADDPYTFWILNNLEKILND